MLWVFVLIYWKHIFVIWNIMIMVSLSSIPFCGSPPFPCRFTPFLSLVRQQTNRLLHNTTKLTHQNRTKQTEGFPECKNEWVFWQKRCFYKDEKKNLLLLLLGLSPKRNYLLNMWYWVSKFLSFQLQFLKTQITQRVRNEME